MNCDASSNNAESLQSINVDKCQVDLSRLFDKPTIRNSFSFMMMQKICDVIGIPLEEEANVRILDHEFVEGSVKPSLILVHLVRLTKAVQHVRGVIVSIADENNVHIVASSFPYTPEYEFPDGRQAVESLLSTRESSTIFKVSVATEGTILRVFNIYNHWYFSTQKSINARNSRWVKARFSDLFNQAWGCNPFDESQDMCFSRVLDKTRSHVFLLLSKENRIVSDYSQQEPILSYVGAFEKTQDGKMIAVEQVLPPNPRLKLPTFVENRIQTFDDVASEMKELEDSQLATGLLFTSVGKDGKMQCIKLMSPSYAARLSLRGGESSLLVRYLQLKLESLELDDPSKLEKFIKLFGDEIKIDEVEEDMKRAPEVLAKWYRIRFPKPRRFIEFPPVVFYVLRETYQDFDRSRSVEENIADTLRSRNASQWKVILKFLRSNFANSQ